MEQQERRTTKMAPRAARVVGGTAGTSIAVIVAWLWNEYTGRPMTAEVSAAVGGLASTCIICLQDFKAMFYAILNRRRSK